jgi:hypothetical protein
MTAIVPLHEYRTIDKSTWGDGPWQQEPDKLQWIDPATGLDCLMVRNHFGNWCGYVGVADGHPFFGISYGACAGTQKEKACHEGEHGWCDHSPGSLLEVHGGLTYSDFCQAGGEADSICHIPEPGRTDRIWWLGFDCGHAGDMSPGMDARYGSLGLENHQAKMAAAYAASGWDYRYRDQPYVEAEVIRLAQQIAEYA